MVPNKYRVFNIASINLWEPRDWKYQHKCSIVTAIWSTMYTEQVIRLVIESDSSSCDYSINQCGVYSSSKLHLMVQCIRIDLLERNSSFFCCLDWSSHKIKSCQFLLLFSYLVVYVLINYLINLFINLIVYLFVCLFIYLLLFKSVHNFHIHWTCKMKI